MNIQKEQKIDMYIQKISGYSVYVDSLSRLVRELIENGDDNFKSTDLPNFSVLLEKLSNRLRILISKMEYEWEK